MFDLVHAVNQQCVVGPTDLLILTKFAELVRNPYNPVYRISIKRFSIITRLSERTVYRRLQYLDKIKLLECIDGKNGEEGTCKLYRLNLPEGFNIDDVIERRAKYYGGKWVSSKRNKKDQSTPKGEQQLSPVMEKDVTSGTPDKMAETPDKMAETPDKMTPINNIITTKKENNNNKEGEVVVVDSAVEHVLEEAARVTNSVPRAFEKLKNVITPENAELALMAVQEYEKNIQEGTINPTHPIPYLRTMIVETIAQEGTNLAQNHEADDESPPRETTVEDVNREGWKKFLSDGDKGTILGKERIAALVPTVKALFPFYKACYDLRSRWKDFNTIFTKENPVLPNDPDELAAAIKHAAEEAKKVFDAAEPKA